MQYKIFVFTVLMVLSLTFTASHAQNDKTGALNGRVINQKNREGIADVNIRLPKMKIGTVTEDEGYYRISKIPGGKYRVMFSYLGFQRQSKTITIKADTTVTLDVSLRASELSLDQITVTGSPTAIDPLKSTADVSLLAGKSKMQQQQASMGETVDKQAGISTINTGSNSGKPVIRGLSGKRIRMLHNGIALDYQQYGVRHMPNMDPFLAERIEIVQGPSSVLYGSDAMGGVINFITDQIEPRNEAYLEGNILGDYQINNNQWTSGLNLQGATGEWEFSGALVRRSGGNITTPDVTTFSEPGSKTGDPKFAGELNHTDFDQLNGSLSAGYSDNFGNIALNYMHWGDEHNFLLPNGKGLGQRLSNDILQARGKIRLDQDNYLEPKLTYVRNLRQSNKGGRTRKELPEPSKRAHLDILREIYSGRLILHHQKIGKLDGQAGIEIRRTDQVTRGLNEPLVPSADLLNIGAFLFEDITFGNLTLSAGGRFDYHKQEAYPNKALNLPDSGESNSILTNDYKVFSGSFGANYRINEELAIIANIGRGFRAPGIFELHGDGIHGGIAAYQKGDPSLKPETNLNTDLLVKWQSTKFKWKVTAYRNLIKNYIFLVNTGSKAPTGEPILKTIQGDARLMGGYTSLNVRILPSLHLKGQFEIVKGRNVEDLANVDELPLLPATEVGGEIEYTQESIGPFKAFHAGIGINHTFAKDAAGRYEPFWQFDELIPFGKASTDAYTLLNAHFGFDIPWQQDAVTLNIEGRNLTNVAYRNFLDTYKGYALSPGRNISFKLNIPFTVIR